jgi:squalene-associated FAD-dependent desaturase
MRYRHLRPRERVGAARAALALARLDPEDPSLDGESFGAWLAAHGQGEAAIDALWNLIALPTLNLPAPEASLALAAFVFQTGLLSERGAGDVGYTRVPLSVVHAERTAGALAAAGVDVRFRHRVEEIAPSEDGTLAVRGAFEPVEADAVVLAVPHDRAAGLLPPRAHPEPERFAKLGKSPIVNVHVVYDRRVTDLPFAAALHSPVQWVFDRTEAAGISDGQYLAVSLSGASSQMALAGEDLAERHVEALGELFPAARTANVRKCFVTREHAATFRATPGSRALRPGPRTAVRGLVLAGAWTDTGWPATMEGAVRSGHAAAREALAALGAAPSPLAQVAA